jgi:hypothetical protein
MAALVGAAASLTAVVVAKGVNLHVGAVTSSPGA